MKHIFGLAIAGLAGIIPLAATAQDAPACMGVEPGQWAGGDAGSSDLSTASGAFDVTTFVPAAGGAAVVNFTLSDATELRYEAKGSFGGDPIATLYAEDGRQVSDNDDGAVDFAVRAEVSLGAGTYCLAVKDVNGGVLPVEIRLGRTEHEALTESVDEATYEGGSQCDTADQVIEATLQDGGYENTVAVSSNVAIWLDLAEPRALTVEAKGNGNDPLLFIENDAGETLFQNDDHTGLDARVDAFAPLQPGRYCVAVSTYEEDGSNVDVSIRTLDEEEAARAQIASGNMSPLAGSDYPVEDLGTLEGRAVRDVFINEDYAWMSLGLDTPSMVRIDALAVNGSDPTIALFDDVGREIARNDDLGGEDYSSRVIEELNAGTYMIGIASVNGTSERSRLIIDQFVRVQ